MLYKNLSDDTLTIESAIGPMRVAPGDEVAIAPSAAKPYLDAKHLELVQSEFEGETKKSRRATKEAE
ncbi:hypothetical protein H6F75_00415 [Nodosilinea sp. FACHB-131]|uniref:hypothetical protein n=1 Tax=Cyanophyceae TaxID=3028117 RepID=UPI001683F1D1|nr:hypothetical protein [Nodosilinea sp. FACHB-131]MBD1871933.1 hypothetical protein [Nodosilinea sp. FACHB-131]